MVETSSSGELYHQRRIMDDGQLLMLVNSSVEESVSATISTRGKSVLFLDLITGEISQIPVEKEDGRVSFEAELPPVGSSVYFISDKSFGLVTSFLTPCDSFSSNTLFSHH